VAVTVRIAIDAKVRAQREGKAPFCELVEPESETRGKPLNKPTMARIHREGFDLENQIVETDSTGGSESAKFSGIEKETEQTTVEHGRRGAAGMADMRSSG
jgi:hypothetical protein